MCPAVVQLGRLPADVAFSDQQPEADIGQACEGSNMDRQPPDIYWLGLFQQTRDSISQPKPMESVLAKLRHRW